MADSRTTQRARPRVALAGLCAGVVAALAGCGNNQAKATSDGYTPAMHAALAAANRIAVDLTTFDFRKLDAFYAKLKAEGTTTFSQNLVANRATQDQINQRLKVLSEGNVVASAAESTTSSDSVTILLFVDQRLRSLGAKSGLLSEVRIQMDMKQVGGEWLVDAATIKGAPNTTG